MCCAVMEGAKLFSQVHKMPRLQQIELEKAGYIASEEINLALSVALHLEKPVLVEGPAGTGKTSIALAAAKALNWELYRIQCYEGISDVQIIGEFNYKKQLLQIEMDKAAGSYQNGAFTNIFSEEFFIKRPLLQAMTNGKPTVLLIDEIDKADFEFEAFLLEALGEKQITVPELGTFTQQNTMLTILTSNATRDLSEALRRRCLYLYLDFPTPDQEKEIIKVHTQGELDEPILNTIAHIIANIRKQNLRKVPSISESIDWAKTLIALGIKHIDIDVIHKTLPILLKYHEDIERIENWLRQRTLKEITEIQN